MTTPNTPCIVLGQIKICTSAYEIPVDNKKKTILHSTFLHIQQNLETKEFSKVFNMKRYGHNSQIE